MTLTAAATCISFVTVVIGAWIFGVWCGRRAEQPKHLWHDYAAAALAGIMANPERWKQIASDYESGKKSYDECSQSNATKAASLADAMLAERAKREGGE